jgi:hypothetical protein
VNLRRKTGRTRRFSWRDSVLLASAALVSAGALLPAGGAQAAVTGGRAAAGASTWGKAEVLPGLAALDKSAQIESAAVRSLSCGSPGNCAAGGYYTDGAGRQQAFVASEVGGTWQKAIEVPGTAALNTGAYASVESVSCAPSGYCAAGGYYTSPGVDEQAFVVTGVNGVWGQAEEVPGTAALNQGGQAVTAGVSCPSAGNCVAVGSYWNRATYGEAFVASQHHGTWQDAQQVPGTTRGHFRTRDPGLDAVSCPSAGNCEATGFADSPDTAFVVSEQDGTWQGAEFVPRLDALNTGSYAYTTGVSCPAAGDCGTGGSYLNNTTGYHAYVASEVNGAWGKATKVTGFAAFGGHSPGISALSCAAPGNCGAVGTSSTVGQDASFQSANQGFVLSEQDGTWGRPELAPGIPVLPVRHGFVEFNGLSCAAPGDCSAGGSYEGYDHAGHAFVIGQAGGTWGTAEQVPGILALDQDGSSGLAALSCAAPGYCSASGFFYRKGSDREYLFVVSEH